MDTFLKACAGVIITLIFCLILAKQGKDASALLSIAVCVMLSYSAVLLLEPLLDLAKTLEVLGSLDSNMLRIIFKCVGIGLIGEITVSVCADAGFSALGKSLETLSAAMILYISIPLFEALLEIVQEILNAR